MADPNVLVLLTDQQRGDTLDADSTCATPNVDRISDGGVRFSRCYAPNPVCSPSRASLLTGELPHTHGMTHVAHTVPSDRPSSRNSNAASSRSASEDRADACPSWGERVSWRALFERGAAVETNVEEIREALTERRREREGR
jgi:arylsulfatase A-like enzyme